MRSIAALLLLIASAQALPAQYCAPAAYLKEIFGSGVTIAGAIASTTTTRAVKYTEADGSPAFDPMDQTCGQHSVTGAASGSIMCGRMKPNTTYYIHPSYDDSTHRGCQTETAAFSCNGVPNFATAAAGEAACEVETDADGANEVIKIRTPATGDAPEAPTAPTHARTWEQGYTQSPDASATVATTSSGGELLATDFLAKVTAAVTYLKANPTETYTVTIPPTARVRRENEGGVGASADVQGFEIPACDGDETGMLIIESETPDPDAMPPLGAPPSGNEEWAHIEWNRNGVLTNTSPELLGFAEPPCPFYMRGVTVAAPPHELKERWTATGTAAVTPGSPRENDSTLLDFTGSTPDVSDAWPTTANAGITVVGLKGDVFHNGADVETGVGSATQFTRSGDTITISGKAALGTAGEARLHNIISLPFTSAAGAALTTPAHPYADSPQTAISSFVDGVLTTAAEHGIGRLPGAFSVGNQVWLQDTDNGSGGDCDGFYLNVTDTSAGTDNGRDSTTLDLKAADGSTGASIPDCNTANGTVQLIGAALLVSDSYPTGIACYVSFPSSTQVQLELCTETGVTTFTPDLTGETGYISYDPPTLPPLIVHPGGAPFHMTNVTLRANRPWRMERAIQLNGNGDGAGTHIVGILPDLGLWWPTPPNPQGGPMTMTKISGYEFTQVVRCFGCSDVELASARRAGGGFTLFGNEFNRPTPHDITKRRWWDEFPNWAISGKSSIVEPWRQTDELKGGLLRGDWSGNIYIGAPEHNTPVAVPFTCKTNDNGYNSDPVLTSTCSDLRFSKSFFSAPQFMKTGVTENAGATEKFEWLTYRKLALEDNVIRMRARKGYLYGEFLQFAGYSNSSFMTLGPTLSRYTDVAVRRNLWLPNLGDANGAGGEWNVLLDLLEQTGSRFAWTKNIHIDNVINNAAGGRFGGTWAGAVEAEIIADGAFSTLADISDNPIAYCFDNVTTNPDYTTAVADACTRGATYWGAAGYADAFDPVACNTSESCATRAGRILDTATNEPLPAFDGYGPQGGMAGVLDAMGFIPNVQAERRLDGLAARLTYHSPDADRKCKTDYALPGVDMDRDSSGVEAVEDTTGSQTRQVVIEGLSAGQSYNYRTRCEDAPGLARGTF